MARRYTLRKTLRPPGDAAAPVARSQERPSGAASVTADWRATDVRWRAVPNAKSGQRPIEKVSLTARLFGRSVMRMVCIAGLGSCKTSRGMGVPPEPGKMPCHSTRVCKLSVLSMRDKGSKIRYKQTLRKPTGTESLSSVTRKSGFWTTQTCGSGCYRRHIVGAMLALPTGMSHGHVGRDRRIRTGGAVETICVRSAGGTDQARHRERASHFFDSVSEAPRGGL